MNSPQRLSLPAPDSSTSATLPSRSAPAIQLSYYYNRVIRTMKRCSAGGDILYKQGNQDFASHNDTDGNGPAANKEHFGNYCFFPLQPRGRVGNSVSSCASSSSDEASMCMPPQKKLATVQSRNANSGDDSSPESIIAKEMNRLTILERDTVYNDIHGVNQVAEEKEWYIDHCLKELDAEMKRLSGENQAYNKALFLNRAYVKDRNFELMFLRTDNYDWAKAARRLVLHFHKKQEIFGNEKLANHITWSDLGEDTIQSLAKGASFCFAPLKDRSGRALYAGFYSARLDNPTSLCHTRGVWYLFMSCLVRDEESQRKGMTAIFFTHGSTTQDYMDQVSIQTANVWMPKALPFRLSAIHLCTQNEVLRSLQSVAVRMVPNSVRTRIRVHCGSLLECMYDMNTFGIETDKLPFSSTTGERDVKKWEKEYAKLREDDERRFKEKVPENGERATIINVRDADVLLGKGYPYQNHPGTKSMMKIVEALFPIHDACSRTEKPAVAYQVVEQVKQHGGRFLQKTDDDHWIEVDDSAARAKAAMGFRNLKRRQNKA